MKILNVTQGSMEWQQARLGIPTASRFDDIITPKNRDYSKSATKYVAELVAEWVAGVPYEGASTAAMEAGVEMEPRARAHYEFTNGVKVVEAGFVLNDEGTVGASPDGLVEENGGVEIKCREPKNHVGCLLGDDIAKPTQVHGCIWICEREWWDMLAFNPAFPARGERVYRDPEWIAALESGLSRFLNELDEAKERMRTEYGVEGTTDKRLLWMLELSVKGTDPVEPDAAEMSIDEIGVLADLTWRARSAGVITKAFEIEVNELAVSGQWAKARAAKAEIIQLMAQEAAS